MAAVLVGGLFASAGTLAWTAGWAWLLSLTACLVLGRLYLARRNPALVAVRRGVGEATKTWDKVWLALFWPTLLWVVLAAALAQRATAAPFDAARFALGAFVFALGMALSNWAMGANPHFEGTARIQRDRDHHVVDAGPYRFLRHPGYLGIVLWSLGSAVMLGGLRASLVPAAVVAAEIVVRTVLEDRMLRRELDGYAAYAARVRWRLLPGLW